MAALRPFTLTIWASEWSIPSGDPDMHMAEKWSPDSVAGTLRYHGSLLYLSIKL